MEGQFHETSPKSERRVAAIVGLVAFAFVVGIIAGKNVGLTESVTEMSSTCPSSGPKTWRDSALCAGGCSTWQPTRQKNPVMAIKKYNYSERVLQGGQKESVVNLSCSLSTQLSEDINAAGVWMKNKNDFYPKWQSMKNTEDEDGLTIWGKVREPLVRQIFACEHTNLEMPYALLCFGSSHIDSDFDCTVVSDNPGTLIREAAKKIVMDLTEDPPSAIFDASANAQAILEVTFDSNFYGSLSAVPASLMAELNWREDIKSEVFMPINDSEGANNFILASLCNRPQMEPVIEGIIDAWSEAAKNTSVEPPDLEVNWEVLMDAMEHFYDQLIIGTYVTDGQVKWDVVFCDYMKITMNSAEAYITPATVYDIVLLSQQGLIPPPLIDGEKECVDFISAKEQIRFIFQHAYVDFRGSHSASHGGLLTRSPGPGVSTSSAGFLVNACKYFARIKLQLLPANRGCDDLEDTALAVKARRPEINVDIANGKCNPYLSKFIATLMSCLGTPSDPVPSTGADWIHLMESGWPDLACTPKACPKHLL